MAEKEKPVTVYAVENTHIIIMLGKQNAANSKLINYAKTNPVTSLIPEDILTHNNAITDNLMDLINYKQNIPAHAQSLFLLERFSSLGIPYTDIKNKREQNSEYVESAGYGVKQDPTTRDTGKASQS